MSKIKDQINSFVFRIQKALDSKNNNVISQKITLYKWIASTLDSLKKQNQDSQKNQPKSGVFGRLFGKGEGPNEELVKRKKYEKELLNLQTFLDDKRIPGEFNFSEEIAVPEEIQGIIDVLKVTAVDFTSYFTIKCPLFETSYIEQASANKLMSSAYMEVDNLKFSRISPELVNKYQRLLMQELLGRVFRDYGSLGVVIQLKSLKEATSPTYFFVQDFTTLKEFNISFGDLVYDDINTTLAVRDRKQIKLNQDDFIDLIISELMTLSFQTVIPQYACISNQKEFSIIKYYDYKSEKNEKDGKIEFDKEYAGLRSAIFFFKQFLVDKQYYITKIQKSIYKFDTFNRYFTAVQIFLDLKKNDFDVSINLGGKKELVPSLIFLEESVQIISTIFHNILVLREWLDEVVKPIRQTINLWLIIQEICPLLKIFNTTGIKSPIEYSSILNRFDIGSFISDKIDKNSLSKFLDFYRPLTTEALVKSYLSEKTRFNIQVVFRKFLEILDLQNYKAQEAVHLIQIFTNNTTHLQTNTLPLHLKNVKVWRNILTAINNRVADFSFLNVEIEMAPYFLGLDPMAFGMIDYFLLLETTQETPKILNDVVQFGHYLIDHFKEVFEDRISHFLEKCFTFRKLRIATVILDTFSIRTIGYIKVIQVLKDINVLSQEKKRFLAVLEKKHGSMYRKYKWEEIFLLFCKQKDPEKKYLPIETFHFGQCYLDKQVINPALRRKGNDFTLETNTLAKQNGCASDYMYNRQKDVTKVVSDYASFYIEEIQIPGFDYFFGRLLQALDVSYIKPYTTYAKIHNMFFQLTENLQDGFPFPEASKTYPQDFISKLINNNVLSEAIILSLLINPSQISFEDIILRVHKDKKYHFYIKSFGSYNSYAYTTLQPNLIMKNALLLLDIMKQSINPEIIVKYSNMNVAETIRDLFKKLKRFGTRMEEMQNLESTEGEFKQYKSPLLVIPFEDDFIARFSERFHRISDIFKKVKQANVSLTHFDLLEKLSPVAGVYYRSLSEMPLTHSEKWELISHPVRFKINFVQSSLFSFFTSFSQYPIQQNACYPKNLQKLKFVGVSQCLLKLREEQFKNLIFHTKTEEQVINLLLNEDGNNIEFFMRNLDMRPYQNKTQKFILETIRDLSHKYRFDKKHKAFESFYLIGCNVIRQKTLYEFGLERVVYMVLQNSSIITENQLLILSDLQCLTYLRLHKIETLSCIASKKSMTYAFSEPLKFKVLNTLIISMCSSLSYIDIKCRCLRNVEMKRNMKLQSIFVESVELQKISCINNPQLKLQNIGFYVFTGADVFIDDKSCYGDMKKILLEANMDYTKKIYQLLFYILQHFKEIKTKTNLCVTMFKTNKMEQNAKNMLTNVISSFITRFISSNFQIDVDMEKQTYIEFIRSFIINKRLKKLIISENYFKEKESQKKNLNKRLIDVILQCLAQLMPNKYKMLQSLQFKQVHQETLQKVFEVAGVFRAQDHLCITIYNYDDHPEKYSNILYLLGNNKHIPKIKLTIADSNIQDFIFKELSDRLSHKLTSLELINCKKVVSLIQNTVQFEKCKTLILYGCDFNNFSFISSFKNLHTLDIVGCQINDFVALLFTVNRLQYIRYLKMNNVFKNQTDVSEFVDNMSHSKISILDLSNNSFSGKDLQSIDKLLTTMSVEQFTLLGWSLSEDKNGIFDFSNFLRRTRMKKLAIQLNSMKSIDQFIRSLARNQFLLSVTILADEDYANCDFSPFREAKNNNIGELKSNIKIPLWINQILTQAVKKHKHSRSSTFYTIDNIQKSEGFPRNRLGSKNEAKKIGLSLDGGGMRGLLLASQLHYLTENVKEPLHKIFDWIGGTSIGGILSLAATGTLDGKNPICTTYQMKQIFTVYGSKIFAKNKFQMFTNILGSRYPGEGIEGVLNDYFKSCKLSDTLPNVNCLVTSVKRLDNTVKIFNSKQAKLNSYKDFYMKDVGRATSAAPIFFPSAEIRNVDSTSQYSLIDGGIGQNNPSKIVIEELKRTAASAGDDSNYFLLSLGTGRTNSSSKVIPTNAGLRNLNPIIDGIMESNSYFIEEELKTNHPGKYFRMSPFLNLSSDDLLLDNTQQNVLNEYEKIGEQEAKSYFMQQTTGFGSYEDRSLIEWLIQNTRLKYE